MMCSKNLIHINAGGTFSLISALGIFDKNERCRKGLFSELSGHNANTTASLGFSSYSTAGRSGVHVFSLFFFFFPYRSIIC